MSSDPGRFLAWLVLLSTLLTLLLGHIVYLSVFFLLYITWAYTDHIDREASPKDINKDSDENEWLLDKFMNFLQQLDNGNLLSIIVKVKTNCVTLQNHSTLTWLQFLVKKNPVLTPSLRRRTQ